MRPNISITLLTPHVTVERYGELTGLDSDTIKAMLADGRLTRQHGGNTGHHQNAATGQRRKRFTAATTAIYCNQPHGHQCPTYCAGQRCCRGGG